MNVEPIPAPLTARRMFKAIKEINDRLIAAYNAQEFHLRAPFWHLQLPGGGEVKIAHITYRGPLMVFTTFESTSERSDYFLVAPESVVLNVRHEDIETFPGHYAPAEFLDPDSTVDEPESDDDPVD